MMYNLDDLNLEEGHEELQVNPYVYMWVCMYVCICELNSRKCSQMKGSSVLLYL